MKRDTLRSHIDELRAGKQRLLDLLRDNQSPTYPSSLTPETGRAYWRADTMAKVGASIGQEIDLLVELRNAAVELSQVLDQSLNTLRALEQSVDHLVEDSRQQFMDLVSALLSGDPQAHAEAWLEDVLAKKTRDLLKPLGWPLNEYARFLVERDGSPESLIQRIVNKLVDDLTPGAETFERTTRVNIYDMKDARTYVDVTTTRPAAKVEVFVNIQHSYVGDLDVWIEHGGEAWTLSKNKGGSDDSLQKTFTIDTTGVIMKGRWTLHVQDTVNQDEGALEGWTLTVL